MATNRHLTAGVLIPRDPPVWYHRITTNDIVVIWQTAKPGHQFRGMHMNNRKNARGMTEVTANAIREHGAEMYGCFSVITSGNIRIRPRW